MKTGQNERRKELVSWNKDAHVQSLRLELIDGSFYIFPYSRLQFVHWVPGPDQDKMDLALDTHEVQITGKNLRDLGIAFQSFAVGWVRELPARYVATVNPDDAYIDSITVSLIQEGLQSSL